MKSGQLTPEATSPLPYISKSSQITIVTPVKLPKIESYIDILERKILADNDIKKLIWNIPNEPKPTNINSLYVRIGCIGDGNCFFHAFSKAFSDVYRLTYKNYETISESILRKIEKSINDVLIFPSVIFTPNRTNNHLNVYNISNKDVFNNFIDRFRLLYVADFRRSLAKKIANDSKVDAIIRNRLRGLIEMESDAISINMSKQEQIRKYNHILSSQELYDIGLFNVKSNLSKEIATINYSIQPDIMLILMDYLNVDIYLLRDHDLINTNALINPLYGGESLHSAVAGIKSNREVIIMISISDSHYELVGRLDLVNINNIKKKRIHTILNQSEPIVHKLYKMLTG